MTPIPSPVVLLKGSDEVLMSNAVTELVHELVGDGDRSLLVEELSIDQHLRPDDDGFDIGTLVDAAQTPPFLTERRIVVSRHTGVFSTKDAVAALVAYLADPLPSTSLVLVWEKDPRPQRQAKVPAVPKSLADAITGAGGRIVDTSAGSGKAQSNWIDEQLAATSLKLDAGARRRLADHVGSEANRLPGILRTLEGAFGPGARIDMSGLEPFLGEAGDVAPWDLTDAIDSGDVRAALDALQRMLGGGSRHPIQVMASLSSHFLRMVQLDDPDIRNEQMAADVLGIKGSTFPAKKALAGVRRLGSERLAGFVALIAEADLDLRGAKNWPPELVVEVLVARLAGRSRGARSARG